jgi:hypothetical protein
MSVFRFRPWGAMRWLLPQFSVARWSFIGCMGTEERTLAAWDELRSCATFGPYLFIQVNDRASRYSRSVQDRLTENRTRLVGTGGDLSGILSFDLFYRHADLVRVIEEFMEQSESAIVIDISVFPKRFFFPIIKRVLSCADRLKKSDIIVTYTVPKSYPDGAPLAENFSDEWAHLPLFASQAGDVEIRQLVVGVGFQALGLHSYLKGASGLEWKLLVPFPAPAAAVTRSWDLLRQIEQGVSPEIITRYRAHAYDACDTFDRLVSLRNSGLQGIALAPFGPKPMSLGMCIFACLTGCEVFYTQPSVYRPDYTLGIATRDGVPQVYAYAIRIGGRDLYDTN